MLLAGIYPAITTPFYPDGRLYLKKLEHNVDRYSRAPLSGIVVLGSTGEAVHLTEAEQRDVLRIARDTAAEDKVLIAGTGQESAEATLAMTEAAAKLDYDAALVRTPSYYRPQMKAKPESLVAYYRFVADRSPLPVILYSVPPFTAYDLPVELVVQLAEHPNIIGIKESSGSVEKITELRQKTAHIKRTYTVTEVFNAVTGRMTQPSELPLLASPEQAGLPIIGATAVAVAAPRLKFKTRTREVSFQIMAGSAQVLLPSLDAGAAAAVLAFAAAAPTACFEVYAAWKDNDRPIAEEKQRRIVAAAKRVAGEMGIPGLKHALDVNGYYGGPARLPLLPLTAAEKQEVEQHMRDIRN